MIFLIQYDRSSGRLINLKQFADNEQLQANDERLQIELDLNRLGTEHEVVLLKASSEKALRRTHRRYFENLETLVESTA